MSKLFAPKGTPPPLLRFLRIPTLTLKGELDTFASGLGKDRGDILKNSIS